MEPIEPVEAAGPVTPLHADVLAGLRWAAWMTAFVLVIGPAGAVAYFAGAVYQIVRVGWAAGRTDHAPPPDVPDPSPFEHLGE